MIKNHGREKKGTFTHEIIGWNFSFTEMQAAIGIAQMNKLEEGKDFKILSEPKQLYSSGIY